MRPRWIIQCHRIGDEYIPDGFVVQLGPSPTHEESVAGGNDDLGAGAGCEQGHDGPRDRPTGRDHVVDDQAGPIAYLADDVGHLCLGAAGTPLMQDDDRGAEPMGIFGGHRDPPGIGRDTTTSAGSRSLSARQSVGTAVRLSTGMWKKPSIWAACRSSVMTWSTPAASISRATRLAVMGSRRACRLSDRA